MPWQVKKPDLKNDPTYLEPRISDTESRMAQNTKKLEEVFSVMDFGAVGDGVTDDTAAIQSALDYLASRPRYSKKVLTIPSRRFCFTSLVTDANFVTIRGEGFYGSSLYCTDTSTTPALHIKGASWQFDGINFECAENDFANIQKIGILFKRDLNKYPDIDSEFIDCRITQFHYGVEFWGRGLKMQGCLIANTAFCVNLEWMNEGEYLPAIDPNNATQQDSTGFRHFSFIGCRFHSEAVGAIRNAGTNAHKINGIIVVGCNMDIGRALWTGILKDALISSCTITQTPSIAFDLYDGSKDYQISDVIIAGETASEPDRTPINFIMLKGNHSNGVFRNLLLKECRQHGINIRDGVSTNMVFENISFLNPCLEGSSYKPIIFVGANHRAIVRNITLQTTQTLTGVIGTTDATADIQVSDVHIFGNSTNAISGEGTRSFQRLHLLDGFDRVDLVGYGSPEGVVTAYTGSTYRQVDGGAGTTFFVKESGTGNTGWVAK
jgi:hypothetical protein